MERRLSHGAGLVVRDDPERRGQFESAAAFCCQMLVLLARKAIGLSTPLLGSGVVPVARITTLPQPKTRPRRCLVGNAKNGLSAFWAHCMLTRRIPTGRFAWSAWGEFCEALEMSRRGNNCSLRLFLSMRQTRRKS